MRRVLLAFVLAVFVLCATAYVRAFLRSNEFLESAQAFENQGKIEEALSDYQIAMRAYVPFASAPKEAALALQRLNTLESLNRLRGGILATRSFYSPFGEMLPATNQKIAELMADETLATNASEVIRGRSREKLISNYLAFLQLDQVPSPWWSLVLIGGLLGWMASVLLFIFRGLTKEGGLNKRPAIVFAVCAMLSFGVWLLGLWKA